MKNMEMDLTECSETSAKLNVTPGKYPKENIQVSEHGENLKSGILSGTLLSQTGIQRGIITDFIRFSWEKNVSPVRIS
jgi:hypothetical protein